MSQPARLTSSLLARKGQASPAGDRCAAANVARPLPAPAPPRPCGSDNVRPSAAAPRVAGTRRDGRVAVTVRLDPARHARLRNLAARRHRTSQDVMVAALDAYLEASGPECACLPGEADCAGDR